MKHSLYIVIGPRKQWAYYPKIRRVTKKEPKLGPSELAFQIQLDIPDNILDPIVVPPIVVNSSNIIRSTPVAKVL